jgi:hypothetical protein
MRVECDLGISWHRLLRPKRTCKEPNKYGRRAPAQHMRQRVLQRHADTDTGVGAALRLSALVPLGSNPIASSNRDRAYKKPTCQATNNCTTAVKHTYRRSCAYGAYQPTPPLPCPSNPPCSPAAAARCVRAAAPGRPWPVRPGRGGSWRWCARHGTPPPGPPVWVCGWCVWVRGVVWVEEGVLG